MKQNIVLSMIAVISFLCGYGWIISTTEVANSADIYAIENIPDLSIAYLAPEGTERGQVNEAYMKSKGVIVYQDWKTIQNLTIDIPIDALLIDEALFHTVTDLDRKWLQTQFNNGVVIVSLGLEDKQFASNLGLETIRNPNESDIPIGSLGYRLIFSQILGQPHDINKIERSQWIQNQINDSAESMPNISQPLVVSFAKQRGDLYTQEDLDELFDAIEFRAIDKYKTIAEYNQVTQVQEQR
ncbi:MAG: hypothetical protein AAF639_35755 [Chloroflexota bacterium]